MFAEALKRDPSAEWTHRCEWADAYVARGRALPPSTQGRRSQDHFRRSAETRSVRGLAHRRRLGGHLRGLRGSRLMRDAKNKEADIVFAEALRQYPSQEAHINTEWANAYIERGRDLLRAVKDEDAKAIFARALQRDPSAGARINTAWANTFVDRGKKPLGQGNDEAAKAAFEEALRFDASVDAQINAAWTNAYIERGVKQLDQGNDDAAKERCSTRRSNAILRQPWRHRKWLGQTAISNVESPSSARTMTAMRRPRSPRQRSTIRRHANGPRRHWSKRTSIAALISSVTARRMKPMPPLPRRLIAILR